ncbi:isochorismatase family protein [Lysobacter sp. CA199]|uniref:isochorismatase family protein n=1 Tax=Lysobacter sp. CA199 TaxID=3455608 RepID=UPI003F8D286D
MTAALLVIDVQCGLFQTDPPPAEAAAVIERINALAARARAAGVAVVFVQHEAGAASPLSHGGDGWGLDPRLQVGDGDRFVRKTTPDSFLRTDLQAQLRELEADHVLIAGYASEFCVDTTVRSAAALGYPVTLIADGHTTHDKPHADAAQIRAHHNATLSNVRSFGPVIRAVDAAAVDFAH